MKISTHRPISRIFFVIALIIGLSNSISAQVDFVSNPASVSVNPNDTFSVVIRVEINSGDVDGAEIHLDFDATVLQVNSIDNLSSSQLPIPIRPITFDNINGAIDYVAGTFSPTPPVASFDFVQINFEAIAAGNTSMTYVYNSAVSPLRVSKITSNSFNVLDTANDVPVEVASANEDPVASFFASPTSGDAELLVTVDATASTDDGSIVSYDWDFGDTNTGTGVSATNNYLNQGVYTVTLTVTDNLGATDSSSQNITVNEVVIVDYTITASAGANGTIDPLSATVSEGENQTFTITPDTGYEIEDVFVDGGSVGAVPSYEFVNVQAAAAISATFSLIPVETIPEITLDAAATVSEGGTLNLPLSIIDGDGDLLTVTVTSISNEPQNLQSNQGQNGKGIEPYPFDAGLFLSETSISNVAGSYASTLVFTPTFGDGGSNGDGNAVYTVTVQVNDEGGNSITQELELTVNDTNQFIAEAGITQLEAESYDNQGNTNGGDGIGVEVDGTGFIVGYTGNNDFIEYKLDVETAGLYQLDLFVGVPASAAGKTMEISVDGSLVGTYVAASTGGFGVFATQSININLDAGEQTLRYDFKSPQYIMNIDYFGLTYISAVDLPPTIVALSDVEINEGGTVSVNVQVNDDITTDPAASIIIYDKSVPGGTNNPFTPAVAITGYTFTDNGGGSFTLNWPTMSIDGRSYEARVTGDDEVNSPVETRFTIDIAQNIAEIIPARTFSNPLPWYSSAPVSPFTVIIEDNTAQNLGYVDSGDFVEYLIDVPFAGTYDVEYMAGKGNSGPLSIQLSEENGAAYTALGSVDVNAGGWQTYAGYTHQATFSNTGVQTIRLDFSGAGGVNIKEFKFTLTSDSSPTINAIADVEANEGDVLSIPIIVVDDTNPSATIEIFDISAGGANAPFNPTTAVAVGSLTDNTGGNYTFDWTPASGEGRSYLARVTANDGSNPAVIEEFKINIAQQVPGTILARTFNNPLPFYEGGQSGSGGEDFSVAIETAGNIGYIEAGDYVEYLINVPAAGAYDVQFESANGSGANGSSTDISILEEGNAVPIGTITVPKAGWSNYQFFTTPITFANSGLQTLRLAFDGGVNTREFTFTPSTSNNAPVVTILTPDDGIGIVTGTNLSFTGTALDPEDSDLSSNISWSSDLQGALGTGPNISFVLTTLGTHIITAEVADNDPTTPLTGTATITVTVTETDPSCDARFRVNAGGSMLIASSGNFEEDRSTSTAGGTAQTGMPSAYVNTAPPAFDKTFGSNAPLVSNDTGYPDFLFQTERYSDAVDPDNMKWTFPTGNGVFEVKMLFNENWANENAQPQNNRIFDVIVEGELALDNYRPSGPIGADFNVAKVETYIATVEDGVLNIGFLKISENPSIKGFDICFVSDLMNADPVVAITTPTDGITVNRGEDVTLTGTATDAEDGDISDNLAWTSSDTQISTVPLNGIGAAITAQFVTPGDQTIRATVTDSDAAEVSDEITITVLGPQVAITDPTGVDPLCNTNVTLNWTGTNVLFGLTEHYHIYVNPPDINNIDTDTRISTASQIGQEFWDLTAIEGIIEGENVIVVRVANQSHDEFINTEAQDIITFSISSASITSIDTIDVSECGVDNGSLTINATGTNLEYSIDNGVNFFATNSFTDLAAGDYNIVVQEVGSSSCFATDTVTLVAPEAPSITSVDTIDVSECGVDNGSITINATGTNLEYSIDNGANFFATNSYTDLAAGDYDIVVQEAGSSSCFANDTVTLVAPEAPSITSVDTIDVSECGVDIGSITINATGTNLEYSIDNGANFFATNSFTDLAAGTYDIVVQEVGVSSCSASDTVILTAPEAPSITSVDTTDVSECGVDNGSITINATGTNLEYSIDNGANFFATNSFTDLAAGDYDIVVQEAGSSSCFSTDTVTLVAPEAPSIASIDTIDVSECGVDNGSITINATGTNLEYSIDNGANFFATNSFTDLAAGDYDIVVQEFGTNSCAVMESITLAEPMAPMPIISGPLTYVEGSGGVTLDAGPDWASYLWSPGGETTQTINATAGTYTVTVVNTDGCEGTSVGVIVTEDDDDIAPNAICQNIVLQLDGAGNASITAEQINNGSNDESGIASLAISMETFTCANLGTNSVMLTVTDTNGNVSNCSATVTVEDKVDPMITCPAGITMITSAPQVLMVESATAIDNCDSAIIPTFVRSDNAALGLNDPFPIGQTLIQWTATDASGNVDVCTQTITLTLAQSMANDIIAFEVPGQVGNEVVDANTKTVEIIVQLGTDVSALVPTIQISSLANITPDSGIVQNFGSPVVYTVVAEDGTTQQWTVTVTIEADTTAPSLVSLNPLDNSTDIDEDAILTATFNEPVQFSSGGEITITDLTDNTTFGIVGSTGPITFTGNTLSIDPMPFFEAGHEYNIEIPNTALEDLSGNPFAGIPINGWTFTIFDDSTPPEIICPDDIVVDNDPGECGAVVNYDIPTVNGGNSLLARAIPVVEGEPVRTEGLPTGAFFPIGTTTVTYEVTDENGNTASCSFDVTVNDTELPTISCTTDMNWVAALGDTSLVVNFTTPDFDDNCPSATIVQTAGLASGVAFPIGVTTNTFEVTDASGNKETCSFDITIEAEVPTTLSVTSFILVDADTDQDLFTLVEGMQIDMNSLPTLHLDIRANTTSDVESVRFNLSGELTRSHGESLPPYALFRDLPIGDYMGADFVEGGYSLTGTPYSEDSLRGDQGTPLTVSFSLVDGDPICNDLVVSIGTVNSITECGGSDGSISLSITGATSPITYDWNHDASLNSVTASALSSGSYSVTVTDANGCARTVSTSLSDPAKPTVTLSAFADVLDTASSFALSGGSPSGGTYSGTGVSGGQFNPSTGAGTYAITYTYTDPVTLCTNMSTGQITVTSPSAFALRINTGGLETTYNTNVFMTDAYFNTGNVLDRPQTGLPEPFQTFRYSRSQQMSYDIPLPDGEYIVNLYFAELWFGASGGGLPGAGRRVFDVSIEGQLEEDNLDIFAEVGAETMLIKSHTVTVTGGVLDIDFNATDAVGGERHPVINAIEILGSGVIVPENPIANAGPDREIELPTNELTLDGSGSDPDGGTVTFEWFAISGPNSPGVANINTKDVTVSNLIEGIYVFRLDVTDDENVTVSDLVTVTVLPEPVVIVPEDPIANAGPDREIELPINELTLDGSGSDPDGGSVTFEWFVISGPNSPGVANINTKDVSVSNMIEGTYVFRLDVTDDENVTVSDLVTVTVLPEPVVGDFAMRINAGGTEIVYDNNVFITDTYFDVGRTLDRPQTGLPDPFKTFRYSPSQQLGYDIPVPDGEYTVNLYFAELWFGASGGGLPGAGRRVFDVSIEGQLEEDNLDIFAEVGAETMLIKSHTVTVTGGVLNIDFNSTDAVGGVRHPVINAIEIIENGVSMPTLALRNANTNKSVLSPNPVISITSLSFEKPVQLSDIQVFDVAGRLIRTFKSAEVFAKGVYNLDVYDLESGIYFINALDTQGVLHQKQMVIKK